MVGADWLRSDTREDNLSSRPGSIVQVYFISSSLVTICEQRVLIIVTRLLLANY